MENSVVETKNKLFICPYFREEGGGQEGYQNVLIRGGGGKGVNKDNIFIRALFLLMASLMHMKSYAIMHVMQCHCLLLMLTKHSNLDIIVNNM